MFRSLRLWLADPPVREFLLWCLPALLAGFVLRAVLTWQLPHALAHDDTPDLLETPAALLGHGKWTLHPKKTFLVPALYTVPFLIRIPALLLIPLGQSLLGLGLVAIVGLLCRLWFMRWEVFILPLTLLTAINPYLIWYERTLMAETAFVFCTALLALAGTLYTLSATRGRFCFLCVALVLEAGARPEGKLLFGFGLLLAALVHARSWRQHWPRLAALLALAVVTHFITRTSQAGLLLYTSVTRLTPAHLHCAPGFDPYIAEVRANLEARWQSARNFAHVKDRRQVAAAVEKYLRDHPQVAGAKPGHQEVNAFCGKIASETCLRSLPALPALAYYKFRYTASAEPSGLLNELWVRQVQKSVYQSNLRLAAQLSQGLMGARLSTPGDFQAWVDAHYRPVSWFSRWTNTWNRTLNHFHHRDELERRWQSITEKHPGLPWYFIIGALGVVVTMFRRGTLQPVHIAWGLALIGLWFVIALTANTKPRFRLVFEPYWFIYICLLFDTALAAIQTLPAMARAEPPPVEPALS